MVTPRHEFIFQELDRITPAMSGSKDTKMAKYMQESHGKGGVKAVAMEKLGFFEKMCANCFGNVVTYNNKEYLIGNDSFKQFAERNGFSDGKKGFDTSHAIKQVGAGLRLQEGVRGATWNKSAGMKEQQSPLSLKWPDGKIELASKEIDNVFNFIKLKPEHREKIKLELFNGEQPTRTIAKDEFIALLKTADKDHAIPEQLPSWVPENQKELCKDFLDFLRDEIKDTQKIVNDIVDQPSTTTTHPTKPSEFDFGGSYEPVSESVPKDQIERLLESLIPGNKKDDKEHRNGLLKDLKGKSRDEIFTSLQREIQGGLTKEKFDGALEQAKQPKQQANEPSTTLRKHKVPSTTTTTVKHPTTQPSTGGSSSLSLVLVKVPTFSVLHGKLQQQAGMQLPDFSKVKLNVNIGDFSGPLPKPSQDGLKGIVKHGSPSVNDLKQVASYLVNKSWEKTEPSFVKLSMADKISVIAMATQVLNEQSSDDAMSTQNKLAMALDQLVDHVATAMIVDPESDDLKQVLSFIEKHGDMEIHYGDDDVQTLKNDFTDRLARLQEGRKNLLRDNISGDFNPDLMHNVGTILLKSAQQFGVDTSKFAQDTGDQMVSLMAKEKTKASSSTTPKSQQNQLALIQQGAVEEVKNFSTDAKSPQERLLDIANNVGKDLVIALHAQPGLAGNVRDLLFQGTTNQTQALATLQKSISSMPKSEEKEQASHVLKMITGTEKPTSGDMLLAIEWSATSSSSAVSESHSAKASSKSAKEIVHEWPAYLDDEAPKISAGQYKSMAKELDSTGAKMTAADQDKLHAFAWALHRKNMKGGTKDDKELSARMWQKFDTLPLFQQYVILEIAGLRRFAPSEKAAQTPEMQTTENEIKSRMEANFKKATDANEIKSLKTYFNSQKTIATENKNDTAAAFFSAQLKNLPEKK